ncbi:MAG: hypothetical protein R3D01_11620 [Hyphomicrobiales bacterium]
MLLLLALPISPATADTLQLAQADAAEVSFWDSVKDSDNPAELEAYLSTYPQGTFAALARIRLNQLNARAESSEAAVQEQADADTESAPVHECDTLAADPYDANRKAEGVPFEEFDAEPAVQACEQAVASYPASPASVSARSRALERGEGH